VAQIESLLGEMNRLQVDWSRHSLASGAAAVRIEMSTRHPSLSATALDALAWKFTYDWK
jgi:hypothetical protein